LEKFLEEGGGDWTAAKGESGTTPTSSRRTSLGWRMSTSSPEEVGVRSAR
jgi:hypothetical protein